jgi:protein-L-isoaspartate(D-aspartate) O-methyltransferase
VRAAFTSVPRELFVPDIAKARGLAYVYEDRALVTQERNGVPTSSSSQPAVMALMLEALGVRAGNRVLEIGLGTGYNAALLTHLVGFGGSVTSIDIDDDVVARAKKVLRGNGFPVTSAVADGRDGWPGGAPYDRIIVTASSETVPLTWWEQLAPNGVLVVPLRLNALQIIVVFVRTDEGFRSRELIPGGFMPLRDPANDAPGAGESTATISVRTSLPGRPTQSLSAVGPALARLSPLALRRLVGNLVLDAARTRVVAVDGVPLVWYTALTSDPQRQITAYLDVRGIRFGLADPQSGAFSTFVVERVGDRHTLVGIDTFGPDPTGVDELLAHLQRWIDSGSPSTDRLTIEVSYAGAPGGPALRTVEHPDHRISFCWT